MVHWDADGKKDLLAGLSDGTLKIFLNVDSDSSPRFDGGTFLQFGDPGAKIDIDVGSRATPTVVDWNNDGRKDLVVGALNGRAYLYVNEGTDAAPDFRREQFVSQRGGDLTVPSLRASPHVLDLTGDGKKDLLVGNTNGELLLYANVGDDHAPAFTDSVYVETDGIPLDLLASRSRPFACAWTPDGEPDVLIGASDGQVHLFQGLDDPTGVDRFEPVDIFAAVPSMVAHPNPFRDIITVTCDLPRTGRARVLVRDVRGTLVRTLLDTDRQAAGEHVVSWGGRDAHGRRVAAGVYFVTISSGGRTSTGKFVRVH